jgi:hypothetical protein
LRHQALIDFEANSQADLNAKTAAYLASLKDDRDTWTLGIGPLDEDALALIRVGDLIPVTSSVMGLSASTQRIAHMTLAPIIGEGGRAGAGWFATLEIGAPVRRRKGIKPALVTNNVIIRTNPPVSVDVDGNPEICIDVEPLTGQKTSGAPGTMTFTFPGGNIVSVRNQITNDSMFGDAVTWTPFITPPAVQYERVGGIGTIYGRVLFPALVAAQDLDFSVYLRDAANTSHIIGLQIGMHVGDTPESRVRAVGGVSDGTTIDLGLDPLVARYMLWAVELDGTTVRAKAWPSTDTDPGWLSTAVSATSFDPGGIRFHFNAGSVSAMDVTMVADELRWCVSDPSIPVAFYGEMYGPVLIATAPGSTSTFALPAYPGVGYVPGSLTVFVDGVHQPVITETDPAPPGTFDLGPDPDAGDKVRASWRVPTA